MRKNIDYGQELADAQLLLDTNFIVPDYVSKNQKALIYKGIWNQNLQAQIAENAKGKLTRKQFDNFSSKKKNISDKGEQRFFQKKMKELGFVDENHNEVCGVEHFALKQCLLKDLRNLPNIRKNDVLVNLSYIAAFGDNEAKIEVPLPTWAVDLDAPKITAQQLKLVYFVVACAVDRRSEKTAFNLEDLRTIKISKRALRAFLKNVPFARIAADLQVIADMDVILNTNQIRAAADQVTTKLFSVADSDKKEIEVSFSDAVLFNLWFDKTYAAISLSSIHKLSSPAAISLFVNITAMQTLRNSNRPDLLAARSPKVSFEASKTIGIEGLKTVLKVDPSLPKSKVLSKLSGAENMLAKSGAVKAISSKSGADYVTFEVTLCERLAACKPSLDFKSVSDIVLSSLHPLHVSAHQMIEAVKYHGFELNCRYFFKFLHDEWLRFNFINKFATRVNPEGCTDTFHAFRSEIPAIHAIFQNKAAYQSYLSKHAEQYRQADVHVKVTNTQDPTRADFQADLEDSLARESEEKRAQMLASLENEMRPLRAEIKTVESYLTKLKAQVSELEADGGNGGAYALAYHIREKQIAKFADEIEAFALKRMKASNTFSQDEDWNFSLAERYARKQLTEAKEFLVSATPAKLIALVEDDSDPLVFDDGGFEAAIKAAKEKKAASEKRFEASRERDHKLRVGLGEAIYAEYYEALVERNALQRRIDHLEECGFADFTAKERKKAEELKAKKAEEEAAAAKKEEALKKLSVLYAKEQQLAYEEADDDCYYDDDDDDDDEIIVFTNNRLERGYQEMKQEASVQPTPEVGEPIDIPDFLLTK